jgi:hypothetical protein
MVVQVGYSVVGRSRGRVAPCAVCTWHVETRSTGFFIEPQNQGHRFASGLASKPLGRFSLVWPQNQLGLKTSGNGFLQFGLKTGGDGFFRFGLKTGALVSWLSLKTKVVEGFPVWASKPAALVW